MNKNWIRGGAAGSLRMALACLERAAAAIGDELPFDTYRHLSSAIAEVKTTLEKLPKKEIK